MLWAVIILLASTKKGEKVDIGRDDVVLGSILLLIWPFTMLVLIPAALYFQDQERKTDERYTTLRKELEDEDHRQVAITFSESDLKFLLKLSRKHDYKEKFSPQLIEILRAELLNRATEKSLLR